MRQKLRVLHKTLFTGKITRKITGSMRVAYPNCFAKVNEILLREVKKKLFLP